MAETPETPHATVPEQPEVSAPINNGNPDCPALHYLLVFVISSVVTPARRPHRSRAS